ncbi:MAG: hypothetical protein PHU23_12875 [Dehalococcoidales bacterium]|nr:hypothetical protein [Dehalococcoidales bacterium]
MTLKGKRKAFNTDPIKQMNSIIAAYGGVLPVTPLPRRFPGAAWKDENNIYHIIRLYKGELRHYTAMSIRHNIPVFNDALAASSDLAERYHRAVSIPAIDKALDGPISVPALVESQQAIIYWIRETREGKVWRYLVVTPNGLRGGTTTSKPTPTKGYQGAYLYVDDEISCLNLLRKAFKLQVNIFDLHNAIKSNG